MMNYYIIFTIIVILLVFFFFSKVRIVLTRYLNDKINIDLYIFPFFNYRIDIDELTKQKTKEGKIIESIKKVIQNKQVIKNFCRHIVIEEARMGIMYYYDNPFSIPFVTIGNWMVVTFIENYLNDNFKHVKNEQYEVLIDRELIGVKMLFDGNMRIKDFLWEIIVNRKALRKLIRKDKKVYGTSN